MYLDVVFGWFWLFTQMLSFVIADVFSLSKWFKQNWLFNIFPSIRSQVYATTRELKIDDMITSLMTDDSADYGRD